MRGIADSIVALTSIEVNRRARRGKTDRLDSDKHAADLIRYHTGERCVGAVVRSLLPSRKMTGLCTANSNTSARNVPHTPAKSALWSDLVGEVSGGSRSGRVRLRRLGC